MKANNYFETIIRPGPVDRKLFSGRNYLKEDQESYE